jgi:hypothetical protein
LIYFSENVEKNTLLLVTAHHGKITICHVTFDVNSVGEIITSTV